MPYCRALTGRAKAKGYAAYCLQAMYLRIARSAIMAV